MMNDAHIKSCSESHLGSGLNLKNDALLIWKCNISIMNDALLNKRSSQN